MLTNSSLTGIMQRFFDSEATPHLNPCDPGFLLTILTPLLYEQFPWQESIFQELARSHALIIEGLQHVETSAISDSSLSDLLGGMSLGQAIGATFVLQTGAYQNDGIYNPSWLDQENFRNVLELYPRQSIEATAKRLTASRDEFRRDFASNSHGDRQLARYDYNPLVRTPFVSLQNDVTVAPAPRLILRSVTPGGLYYPGIRRHGRDFSQDLGHLFEFYIGRNLRLIDGAEVHPEISYGPGKGRKSIDWFVVMSGLVLLIECKLKRLGLRARAGDAPLFDDLATSMDKSVKQLTDTLENLAAGTPEFSEIPTGRPFLAMIATAEPTYTGSAYLVERHAASISVAQFQDVPVAAVSARGIEMLVTHGADLEDVLLELVRGHVPGTAIPVHNVKPPERRHNPILEDAWKSYPFPSAD